MRTTLLVALSVLGFACRSDGETKYVPDRDADGLNEDEDCDDADADIGAAGTWYYDADGDGHGDGGRADSFCERPEGYTELGDDCNDADASIFPGAVDACDDVDNDCDGVVDNGLEATAWYTDADGDGYGDDSTETWDCAAPDGRVELGGDCDDTDPAYNPGAPEEDCEDPADYNCDGSVGYADTDGDGYAACAECDDGDAAVNPGATEVCNGLDDDCDARVDDDDDSLDASGGVTVYLDLDADGYGDPATAAQVCDPGPGWVLDATDCDDGRPDLNPGATELCNGLDDDCDGLVDDADDSLDAGSTSAWYTDADGDGYGDDGLAVQACDAPAGTVATAGDCDDGDAAYNPGAVEADCADPADYNCDGSVGYADADGDGWAACEECDDTDATNHPDAAERCDGADNDCDGTVDEADAADASTWYADADADGYGDAGTAVTACDAPAGWLGDATDCDDSSPDVNPAQVERCNGVDDDCDGAVDDGAADAATWYADGDLDGYGDAASTADACDAPAGYVADDTDCDDHDGDVNPSALESCNGVDDDCDGAVDEDSATDAVTWYADADADGHGDPGATVTDCTQPAGYLADADDCDDTDATVYPGAAESCDGVDEDCDGSVDEGVTSVWYADADGDGHGDAASTVDACAAPAGYGSSSDDCDDTDAGVYPGAAEACDGEDDDCDGVVDEGVTSTWYADADGDGHGDPSGATTEACSAPSGYAAAADDCDDGDAGVNPGEADVCDTVDNDCDGAKDNDGLCPCDVEEYGGHAYLYCTTASTWAAAETSCLSYGYDFVAIGDAAEDAEVNAQAFVRYGGKWWIGFTDASVEGTWAWADGSAATYTNWAASEPNDSGGNEDCAQLGRYYPAYTWNDEPCTSSFAYVCEE